MNDIHNDIMHVRLDFSQIQTEMFTKILYPPRLNSHSNH